MEHELSAVYDITHGLGLAILTPRWMEYCLDESNVERYVSFGVNVFGIDSKQEPMAIAKQSIERLSELFFKELGLQSTFTEIGIKSEDFPLMAQKACRYGDIKGFKTLTPEDVEKIYEMCL
jgi:alcohol dehydrogenase YqhD (iron-dependent ADH family)